MRFQFFLVTAAVITQASLNPRSERLLLRQYSADNTCGSKNGYKCNPSSPGGGSCCSSSGYCGNTSSYCGSGCQPGYGTCSGASDNSCGSKNGYQCDPKSPNGGSCCSSSGFCGNTIAYCGTGCQKGFGTCAGSSSSNTCGPNNGFVCNATSPNGGPCCSSSGYCGSTTAYCSTANGCQSQYGSCGTTTSTCSTVSGVGNFAKHVVYDFNTITSMPSGLHAVANPASKDPTAPYSMDSQTNLVSFGGGYMQLLVPGGQAASPIHTAQVQTTDENIVSGSVRTTALFSAVRGTCHGMFFYKSDSQEVDIEFLSDPTSQSNPNDGTTPLHFTNQALDGNASHNTHSIYAIPSDANTVAHEYRVDWVSGYTAFFIDGKQVQKFTTNVPTQAGIWIWNNWSNGGKGWTVGPPTTDNIFKISKIEMYYNTTTSSC